jgi:thiopurine S-methyltransferase
MQPSFWHERWERGQLGFHRDAVHPDVVAYAADWGAKRILVPLCGATRDLGWLAGRGGDVTGVELSPIAAARVFSELGVEPSTTTEGPFSVLRAPIGSGTLTIVVGDFLAFTADGFERVWDRAAMIALPPAMRAAYVAHLRARCAPGAELLLNVLHYQGPFEGPPFSVPDAEVAAAYADAKIDELDRTDLRTAEPRWATATVAEGVTRRIRLPG